MDGEVQAVDQAINDFLEKMEVGGLGDKTNVIVLSDHGMTSNVDKVNLLCSGSLPSFIKICFRPL